jgi:hypothetical protein
LIAGARPKTLESSGDVTVEGTVRGDIQAKGNVTSCAWQDGGPTNHLDIDARGELLSALIDFDGAVILISHDRRLLEAIADRFLLVANGRVEPFDGDLDDYRRYLLSGENTPARREQIAKRVHAA